MQRQIGCNAHFCKASSTVLYRALRCQTRKTVCHKRMSSTTNSQNAANKFSKVKLANSTATQPFTEKFSAAGRPAGITSTMLGDNVYNPQTATDPFSSMTHFSPSSKMHEIENDDRSSSISDTDDTSCYHSVQLNIKGDSKIGVKPAPGKKTRGRVKIQMEYIQNKLRRYTTFSKRKSGIMKKAYELSTLTGTQVMLLVASETGHVYTFATPKLQPMITSETGKALIQTCLHQPDAPPIGVIQNDYDMRMSANGYEETELGYQVAEEDFKGNIHHDPTCLIPVSSAAGIPVMPLNGMPHGMIPMQGFAAMPHPEMQVMTHSQMVSAHQNTQVMSPQHSSPPPSYSPPGHPSSPHRANTFNGNSYPSSPPSVTNFSQGPSHQVLMEEIQYDQRSPSHSPIQHRYSHSPQGLYSTSNASPRM